MTQSHLKTFHSWMKVVVMCVTCMVSIWTSGYYFHEKMSQGTILKERIDQMEQRFDKRFDQVEQNIIFLFRQNKQAEDKSLETQPAETKYGFYSS